MRALELAFAGLVACICLDATVGDFLYVDFNNTGGLSFVGDAATSACVLQPAAAAYQPRHGENDRTELEVGEEYTRKPDTTGIETYEVAERADAEVNAVRRSDAFGTRILFAGRIENECPTRLRCAHAKW